MKGKKTKVNKPLILFSKITGWLGTLILFKPKIYYENKESQGRRLPKSCILMSNHTSLLDYVLYLLIFWDRTLYFLMAEVLFCKNKLFTWLLFSFGGIRIDRNAYNLKFVGEALEILDRGGVVGVFPQGRLPVNGKVFPFKSGIVWIALKTDAPIVPVYTAGNYGLKKRAHVIIGEKIYLKEYCDSEKPTKEEILQLTKFLEQKNNELGELLRKKMGEK